MEVCPAEGWSPLKQRVHIRIKTAEDGMKAFIMLA